MKPSNWSREQSPRPGRVQTGPRVGLSHPSGESRRPPKAPRGPGGVLVDRRRLTPPARLATALAVSLGSSANLTGSLSTRHGCLSTCVPRQTKGATRLRLLPRPLRPSSLCQCPATAVTWWLKTTGVCFFTALEGTQGARGVCVGGGGEVTAVTTHEVRGLRWAEGWRQVGTGEPPGAPVSLS